MKNVNKYIVNYNRCSGNLMNNTRRRHKEKVVDNIAIRNTHISIRKSRRSRPQNCPHREKGKSLYNQTKRWTL